MLTSPFTGEPSIPFTLYAMECEGELDTEAGKRNRVIKRLRQRPERELDEVAVREEALAAGLYLFTDEEVNNILREVIGY